MDDSTGSAATQRLVNALRQSAAYADSPHATVGVHETHISWVFVVGPYAYKVKKPIKTPFLDYRSLAERQRLCHEELRLNSRFAADLYLEVVPITQANDKICVNGSGTPVEYALKMRRFDSDALLGQRLLAGRISQREIIELADAIASFHGRAALCAAESASSPQNVLQEALDNLSELQPLVTGEPASLLRSLQIWTRDGFEHISDKVAARRKLGFVRECHGDLHLGNIVHWGGRYVPFDGIEFSSALRNIDVLSDLAFLSMDLAAHQRNDLRHLLINAYVEHGDDREALDVLRWYEVYRALVRAKVDSMRAQQLDAAGNDPREALNNRDAHILLAHQLTNSPPPTLTITHGPRQIYGERAVGCARRGDPRACRCRA